MPHEPQSDEPTGMTSGRSATSSTVAGVRHSTQGIARFLSLASLLSDDRRVLTFVNDARIADMPQWAHCMPFITIVKDEPAVAI